MMPHTPTDPSAARRTLCVITTVAIALRVAVALLTIDIPGDGPARATWAYRWSQSPELISYGLWPPGLTYLAGGLCMLIPNPRTAPRLLNIILGSASIPLLYAVSRRLFGTAVALTAAALLAVFPLHIGLSASSLTEAAFLCGMLAVLDAAFAVEERCTRRTILCLAAVVLLGVFVEMIRYEAWFLLPMVGAYVAYRLRSVTVGIGLTVTFLVFPVAWSLQNHWYAGDAFPGFRIVVTEGGEPVSPFMALRLQWRMVRNHLGPLAALIMLAGGVDAAIRVARRETTAERRLYIGLAAVAWAALFAVMMRRGGSVDRYYVLALTFTFPLAVIWLYRRVADRRILLAIAAACLALFATTCVTYRPTIFVTRRRFPDIDALVAWRAAGIYRADAVLLTRMNWEATYVPFYAPDLAGRTFIVAPGEPDAYIRDFFRRQRPSLLVTRADDVPFVHRVEQLLGSSIGPEHLVTTIGQLQVFDIRHLTQDTSVDVDSTAKETLPKIPSLVRGSKSLRLSIWCSCS